MFHSQVGFLILTQEKSGNIAHIHGLIGLKRSDLERTSPVLARKLRDHICSLQKNCVGDLFPLTVINEYIDKGLFRDEQDWVTCTAQGQEVLTHKCDERCKICIGDGDGLENFCCRKKHPVHDSIDPLND